MNHFVEAVATVGEGANFEKEENYAKAKYKYNCALLLFRRALVSDEKSISDFHKHIEIEVEHFSKKIHELEMKMLRDGKYEKDLIDSEEKNEVKHYIERIRKLEILLKGKPNSNCDSDDPDVQIRNRVKSTMLKHEEKPKIKFDDVCGLELLKEDLFQAALLPLMQPQLFSKYTQPYKGFLLFGPPGTGKTFVAKALAGEIGKTNFFSISVGDVLSKFLGESETFIRNLYIMAREARPSIIFFDEIDVLAKKRTIAGNDSCQGVLNELLAQIDGLKGSNEGVLTMATTNVPQQLDSGILRRFDKLIYVPLPTLENRRQMFKIRYSTASFTNDNFDELAAKTKGFSGSDIDIVCNEANNKSITRVVSCTSYKVSQEEDGNTRYVPCFQDQDQSLNLKLADIPYGCLSAKPKAEFSDLIDVISKKQPSIPESEIGIYETFFKERVQNRNRSRYTQPVPEESSFSILDILCIFSDCFY